MTKRTKAELPTNVTPLRLTEIGDDRRRFSPP